MGGRRAPAPGPSGPRPVLAPLGRRVLRPPGPRGVPSRQADGRERLHPEEDRGLAGPIGTVQLANLRRGLQDHQYLTLARKLGLEDEVKAALAQVVPRVFSDAGETVGFAETGDTFEAARLALGEAIEARMPKGEK